MRCHLNYKFSSRDIPLHPSLSISIAFNREVYVLPSSIMVVRLDYIPTCSDQFAMLNDLSAVDISAYPILTNADASNRTSQQRLLQALHLLICPLQLIQGISQTAGPAIQGSKCSLIIPEDIIVWHTNEQQNHYVCSRRPNLHTRSGRWF